MSRDFPAATSHSRKVRSRPTAARVLPSGLQARPKTASSEPLKDVRSWDPEKSQIWMVPSRLLTANAPPSGRQATSRRSGSVVWIVFGGAVSARLHRRTAPSAPAPARRSPLGCRARARTEIGPAGAVAPPVGAVVVGVVARPPPPPPPPPPPAGAGGGPEEAFAAGCTVWTTGAPPPRTSHIRTVPSIPAE